MKLYINSEDRHFKTPFHAYQFANIKSMETILEDIESDKLVSNIGQMFDVQFPIDDKRNMEMREGIESPWKKNDVPF